MSVLITICWESERNMARLLTAISFFLLLTTATASIQVVDNGYTGIVISIDASIKENPDLLTKLERYWTDASAVLFRATKNQLYFKEFLIVLPEDWQPRNDSVPATGVDKDNPDIIVELTGADGDNTPYAPLYTECGKPGLYIHLTSEYFLLDAVTSNYGPAGKTLVHEWGHYRWGLFDEYPYPDDDKFYRDGSFFFPTRCSKQVVGISEHETTGNACKYDVSTGGLESGCRFYPYQSSNAKSSMMYMQFLDNVVEFCDNPDTAPEHLKHNRLAPNRHNRICEEQSAWEVMRKHTDFTDLTGKQPLPNTTNTRPVFKYVQTALKKQVLVLDVSGSMSGSPLLALRQAASQYILSEIETGSHLGIVVFSSSASISSSLVEINSNADRDLLADRLPTSAGGGTNIGNGLRMGLQVLETGLSPDGGSIILISDGKDNRNWADSTLPSLLQKGVKVHTIAIGQAADLRMGKLSDDTGGKKVFYNGKTDSTALMDGFSATRKSLVASTNASLTVLTETGSVTTGVPSNGTFYIDSTIGRETTLTFSYTQSIAVTIESPDGPYDAVEIKNYPQLQILNLFFKNDLTPGQWTYHVTTTTGYADYAVNIQSKPRNEHIGIGILQIYSWISESEDIAFDVKRQFGVYTSVSRGQLPVMNAIVIATVERPGSDSLRLNLADNGIGSDIIKDDGIYSGTMIAHDLTGDGRYNLKIKVVGTKSQTKIAAGGSRSASNGAIDRNLDGMYKVEETEPVEDFQRVATAGEFRITGFSQAELDASPDALPPARIRDLRVKSFDADSLKATLVWTAVGDDMERGQAAGYMFYASTDRESVVRNRTSADLVSEGHVKMGNMSFSLPAGEREEFVLQVEALSSSTPADENVTVFINIIAVDEMGNKGKPSNVVTLSRASKLDVSTDESDVSTDVSDDDDNTRMYIAIGVGATCFVLAVVIVIAVVVLKGKVKEKIPHKNNKIRCMS